MKTGEKIHFDNFIIPSNARYIDFKNWKEFAFEVPAKKRILDYSGENIPVVTPKLLMWVYDQSLKVFALGKTQLYYLPLWNNFTGGVCTGGNQFKTIDEFSSFEEYFSYIESMFFDSPFAHAGDIKNKLKMTQKEFILYCSEKGKISLQHLYPYEKVSLFLKGLKK